VTVFIVDNVRVRSVYISVLKPRWKMQSKYYV